MIIDCAHYRGGRRQHDGPIAWEEAAVRRREGGFVWLAVSEPGPGEMAKARENRLARPSRQAWFR